ncbi:hypothetical protein DESUT3_07280 [Desulfuromonas versatilis]|uniref:DUF2917 domain-containing protein n=1 Tax=Desulfuromonas versatilis TaxID=2802975 RepID=A0ABM8HPN6_9BACT|nr:DUF2917 domain-containing protein [Desulfuromonas versatilis]BCR03659.1 hypothetical protein DESUT3_07280 [Desulfuromonas versatilis]
MDMLLREGEILTLQGDARGVRLRCADGVLWITQPGDSNDYLLRNGREFTVARRGTVVVLALREARVAALPRRAANPGRVPWQLARAGA